MIKNIKSQQGLAAIVLVVMITAVSLIFVKSISWLGLNDIDISQDVLKGEQALSMASACIDETLLRYHYDENYTPDDESIIFDNGECIVNANSDGDERSIEIIAQYENYYRELNLDINLASSTSINNISL